MAWYEEAFDALYPVLYPHRDRAEAELAVLAFADLLAGRARVLDLGCGAGRYLSALVAHDVAAFGLDLSEFLLHEAAVREGMRGRLVRADMRRLPFVSGSLDAVINMFTSFGYFAGDVDNVVVIQEVSRVLAPRGVFVIDFLNAHKVRENPGGHTKRERSGYVLDEDRYLDDGDRYLVKRVLAVPTDSAASEVAYEERVRMYTDDELADMIRGAGMRIVGQFGDYSRGAFDSAASDRLIFACEKPETQ